MGVGFSGKILQLKCLLLVFGLQLLNGLFEFLRVLGPAGIARAPKQLFVFLLSFGFELRALFLSLLPQLKLLLTVLLEFLLLHVVDFEGVLLVHEIGFEFLDHLLDFFLLRLRVSDGIWLLFCFPFWLLSGDSGRLCGRLRLRLSLYALRLARYLLVADQLDLLASLLKLLQQICY